MSLVVPAVLPASKREFEETLALFANIPSVSRVQIDSVDDTFATPASWPYLPSTKSDLVLGAPYPELEAMVQKGEMLPHLDHIVYEVDLMCLDALAAASLWLALGATRLTFHAESATDLPRLLSSARIRYGTGGGFASDLVSFGLAINVASDLALLEPCLGEIEYVQCMGIARIGRQGQPFDERVFEKVRILHSRHPDIAIQVDGGVSLKNAKKFLTLGVSNLIVGSEILRAADPAAALAEFEALQTPYGV